MCVCVGGGDGRKGFRSSFGVVVDAVVATLVMKPFCSSILFSLVSSSTMLTGSGLPQGLNATSAPSN